MTILLVGQIIVPLFRLSDRPLNLLGPVPRETSSRASQPKNRKINC